jgi:hypothetical protein
MEAKKFETASCVVMRFPPWTQQNRFIHVKFLGWPHMHWKRPRAIRWGMSQPQPWIHNQGKGLRKCGPRVKPGSHISCSWECGRMWRNEPPHSQMSSHFASWSPNGLPNFQKAITRVKIHWIEEFFISLEALGTYLFKMGLHDPFGYLKHKLWPKERLKSN